MTKIGARELKVSRIVEKVLRPRVGGGGSLRINGWSWDMLRSRLWQGLWQRLWQGLWQVLWLVMGLRLRLRLWLWLWLELGQGFYHGR